MFFSIIRLRPDISPRDIAGIANYNLHKLVWNIFSDDSDRRRDFLYRYESVNGWPTFYAVSERKPEDSRGIWEINEKTVKLYDPMLSRGERLAFKLRANPVHLTKIERSVEEIETWRNRREERGLKSKEPTKKRVRHDVVMEMKNRIGFKNIPHERRPHVASLIQEAGLAWLKANENGFSINGNEVRADGYCQHKLFKGKGIKPICFSTLEFNGILTVTDPGIFISETLFKGLGPAKGFGCGLMLVRRIKPME